MKPKLNSFYSKISLIFLLLILILGTAILIITFSASSRLFDEVEQLLNKEYAASIAQELQPIVIEGFDLNKIEAAIHYMMVLNPMVEIYLLDSNGIVMAFFTTPGDKLKRDKIDLIPIKKFTNGIENFPILGDDPRSTNKTKPFSVANLKMGSNNGYVYVILRGEDYDKSIRGVGSTYYIQTAFSTLIFTIMATLIIGLVLFFLLTKRLRILNKSVIEFKNGNYKERVIINGDDEISILGTTLNNMASSIESGIEKLKNADKEKSDLISNISHDLRSPLTSAIGHLETLMLKDEVINKEMRADFLNTSLKNLFSFQNLVDKLFELSKLESNQVKLSKEDFSLTELIQDVTMKYKPLANSRKIKINLDISDKLFTITADIGMLERAISNIVENGIKYNKLNGILGIDLKEDLENYFIEIKDTGIGISQSNTKLIFNRFYRVKGSQENGTGLGLSIVKEIINLHKGSILLQSTLSIGSCFIITLPK